MTFLGYKLKTEYLTFPDKLPNSYTQRASNLSYKKEVMRKFMIFCIFMHKVHDIKVTYRCDVSGVNSLFY